MSRDFPDEVASHLEALARFEATTPTPGTPQPPTREESEALRALGYIR